MYNTTILKEFLLLNLVIQEYELSTNNGPHIVLNIREYYNAQQANLSALVELTLQIGDRDNKQQQVQHSNKLLPFLDIKMS